MPAFVSVPKQPHNVHGIGRRDAHAAIDHRCDRLLTDMGLVELGDQAVFERQRLDRVEAQHADGVGGRADDAMATA